jgi:Cu-Zn family superoxide dismutase
VRTKKRYQDTNRSNIDECDSDDIFYGCAKPEQPESEDYHFDSVSSSSGYPSRGTSNSSNSTGDPFSDSDSLGDSSDTAAEAVEPAQYYDLCAQVWFEPTRDSDLWGWAQIYQPADGNSFSGYSQIKAGFENLEGAGEHGFHVHEFGDLRGGDCDATGGHYNPEEEPLVGELQEFDSLYASWRGVGTYQSWNPLVKLDGETSVLGRSLVVHALDGSRVGCGIIKPGCSPCADGNCRPPAPAKKNWWEY